MKIFRTVKELHRLALVGYIKLFIICLFFYHSWYFFYFNSQCPASLEANFSLLALNSALCLSTSTEKKKKSIFRKFMRSQIYIISKPCARLGVTEWTKLFTDWQTGGHTGTTTLPLLIAHFTLAADDALFFDFYLLKKIRLDVLCESSTLQRIHVKYQVLGK